MAEELNIPEELVKQLELLNEVIGPMLHADKAYYNQLSTQFFEGRDNTVEDAARLTRMLVYLFIGQVDPTDGAPECAYFHEVVKEYERDLSELN